MGKYGISEIERISSLSREAVQRLGGFCAAAAVEALGNLLGVQPEEAVLRSGTGIRFSGPIGPGLSAYAGTCQFLAEAARIHGLGPREQESICRDWQNCFDSTPEEEKKDFDAVLLLALWFFQSQGFFEPEKLSDKPKQYYDRIYADRDTLFHHSPYALEEQLTHAVRQGNRQAALETLREITRHGEKAVVARDPVRSAKNSMIGSIAFLSRAAIQAGVSPEAAFSLSDSLIQQVEDLSSRTSVLAFEERIALQFIDLVKARLAHAWSPPITRAVHYIENNLDKKLYLADAAGYAGVHPAYLSARFRQETGASFCAYVLLRKIQESTYFVRHSDYSVSQIALLYGFASQSYYITSFRRLLGMTPMEYRARYLTD